MTRRPIVIALSVLVLAAAAIVGAMAYFNARDDATLKPAGQPGAARPARARPTVSAGNLLLLYADARMAPAMRSLARDLGGGAETLQATGQAVLVRHDAHLHAAVSALSAHHRLDTSRADDPALRAFAEYWLGRAPG